MRDFDVPVTHIWFAGKAELQYSSALAVLAEL
jgi:hypothetical protein